MTQVALKVNFGGTTSYNVRCEYVLGGRVQRHLSADRLLARAVPEAPQSRLAPRLSRVRRIRVFKEKPPV
jgi:hypothetical protein